MTGVGESGMHLSDAGMSGGVSVYRVKSKRWLRQVSGSAGLRASRANGQQCLNRLCQPRLHLKASDLQNSSSL
jgi:hypothetical protein